jgi:hypothetical protein
MPKPIQNPPPDSPPLIAGSVPETTPPAGWEEVYFHVLSESGQKLKAAKEAKVPRTIVFRLVQADPTFAAREREALAVARDGFESEVVRRAIEGVAEARPGRSGGESITHVEYSDGLLVKILERHDPAWDPKPAPPAAAVQTYPTAADRQRAIAEVSKIIAAKAALRIAPRTI